MFLYSSVEAVLVGLDFWIDAADWPGFAHHTAKREIETTADFQNPNKHDPKGAPWCFGGRSSVVPDSPQGSSFSREHSRPLRVVILLAAETGNLRRS